MTKGSKVGTVAQFPKSNGKNVKSLNDDELALAYECAVSLMRVGIPTAVQFDGTGVVYDGQDNVVHRRVALVWLTCKGVAVITAIQSSKPFVLEQLQVLANGVAKQYQQDMAGVVQ